MRKIAILSAALLMLGACHNRTPKGALPVDGPVDIRLDAIGLQGDRRLDEYRVGCESVGIPEGADYLLSFDEQDNAFALTTDCNSIGGGFDVTNDTVRFRNMMVTEMACDNMTVEENMLRLLNDTAAYATYAGDTLRLVAPQTGSARFVRR